MANLQRRTPRNINKRCHSALMRAFEKGIFEKGEDLGNYSRFYTGNKSGRIG